MGRKEETDGRDLQLFTPSLRGYRPKAVWLLRDTKKRKDNKGEAVEFVMKARGLLLVQGGGGAPDAAASSHQSVEFDSGLKAARSFWKAAIDVENNKQNLNVIVFQMRR